MIRLSAWLPEIGVIVENPAKRTLPRHNAFETQLYAFRVSARFYVLPHKLCVLLGEFFSEIAVNTLTFSIMFSWRFMISSESRKFSVKKWNIKTKIHDEEDVKIEMWSGTEYGEIVYNYAKGDMGNKKVDMGNKKVGLCFQE